MSESSPGKINKVRLRRDALLGQLKKNRETHIREFKEAHAGWKKEVEVEIRRCLSTFLEQGKVDWKWLPEPKSHESDYDRVIAMLEVGLDEEIILQDSEFQQYWQDEWQWQHEAKTHFANYAATARAR